MIGYFEGLGSEGHRLAGRRFPGPAPLSGLPLERIPPEHSSLSRIRQRLPVEVHQAVFDWVLKVLADHDLRKGKSVAVDATSLEANAAMRSIVRRARVGRHDIVVVLGDGSWGPLAFPPPAP